MPHCHNKVEKNLQRQQNSSTVEPVDQSCDGRHAMTDSALLTIVRVMKLYLLKLFTYYTRLSTVML